MNKDQMVDSLELLKKSIAYVIRGAIIFLAEKRKSGDALKKMAKSIKAPRATPQELALSTKEFGRMWFDEISKALPAFDVPQVVISKYDARFTELLGNALYDFFDLQKAVGTFFEILLEIGKDLLLPVYTYQGEDVAVSSIVEIMNLATQEEREYLQEAHACAKVGCLRAAVVLGWSAATHRMQKTMEKMGFNKFNEKSLEMKRKNKGRFRLFKKEFSVSSLSEFRASVFDTDLLWVLEYWGFVDKNQHDRLLHCHTMRCNAAHPGEAPMTIQNLESYFSDIRSIVFEGHRFTK